MAADRMYTPLGLDATIAFRVSPYKMFSTYEIAKKLAAVSPGRRKARNVMGVLNTHAMSLPPDVFTPLFHRVSPEHGRSMSLGSREKPVGERLEIVHGMPFMAKSRKGADFVKPSIEYNTLMPDDMSFHGLVEAKMAERMIVVGSLFLEHGIDSELVYEVNKIEQFPYEDPKTEKIKMLHLRNYRKLIEPDAEEVRQKQDVAERKYNSGEEMLQRKEFVTIDRYMPIEERIRDLASPGNKKEFDYMMQEITAQINVRERYQAQTRPGFEPTYLTYDGSQESIHTYLDYLAKRTGENMAKVHALGIALKNGTAHNFTADGSICDLESPTGTILYADDPQTKPEDKTRDIGMLLYGDDDWGVFKVLEDLTGNDFFPFDDYEKLQTRFANTFISSYAKTRFGKDTSQDMGSVGYLIESTNAQKTKTRVARVRHAAMVTLVDELGIDLSELGWSKVNYRDSQLGTLEKSEEMLHLFVSDPVRYPQKQQEIKEMRVKLFKREREDMHDPGARRRMVKKYADGFATLKKRYKTSPEDPKNIYTILLDFLMEFGR